MRTREHTKGSPFHPAVLPNDVLDLHPPTNPGALERLGITRVEFILQLRKLVDFHGVEDRGR